MEASSRKSAAVMFTDLAGFTAQMERNEVEALETVSLVRDTLLPLLEQNNGSLMKEMGDGTLSVFLNPRSAMKCAGNLQQKLYGKPFQVRIGIHWGKVLLQKGDVLGDTVNVASRLEAMAPPGGVCVSGELLDNCGPGRKPPTHRLGLRKLKGLGRLIDIFTMKGSSAFPLPVTCREEASSMNVIHLLEELPSVAVMPLSNLGSSEDDFYAHGITSDLISDIASAGRIAVTPLSDVIKLKKAVNSDSGIAERLSVRFLVKGTLWKKENRFQLSVELHDLKENRLSWTDNWTDDWFELQSIKGKMADSLLKALGVQRSGPSRSFGEDTALSEAYKLYLRAGEFFWNRRDFSDVKKAESIIAEVLAMDPELVPARILLGTLYSETGKLKKAETELHKAYEITLDKGDRAGHLGVLNRIGINQWKQSDFKAARNTFLRTLMLSRTQNDLAGQARSLSNLGLMECNLGHYDKSLEYMEKTMEVPGIDSMGNLKANTLCNTGLTLWSMGDNTGALEYYKRSLALFEKLEDLDGQANMMMNLGIVARNTGKFRDCLHYTGKAYDLNCRLGDLQGQCLTLIGIGNTHRYTGLYEKALESYGEALDIAVSIGDRNTESIAKTNIADVFVMQKMYREAEDLYRTGLEICREIGDKEGEGENLALLGNVYRLLGMPDDAVGLLKGSISLLEEIGAFGRTSMARLSLAQTILDRGTDPNSLKEAMDQAGIVEGFLTPHMNDLTEVLFTLSEVFLRFAGIPAAGDPEILERRSRGFLEDAYHSMMSIAMTIDDPLLRESFLNVDLHRRTLSARQDKS